MIPKGCVAYIDSSQSRWLHLGGGMFVHVVKYFIGHKGDTRNTVLQSIGIAASGNKTFNIHRAPLVHIKRVHCAFENGGEAFIYTFFITTG